MKSAHLVAVCLLVLASSLMACASSSHQTAAASSGVAKSESTSHVARSNEFSDEMGSRDMARLYSTPVHDCNGNAVPDSVDIKEGYARDVNRNGIIDDCDPDDEVAREARSGSRWWRYADIADSSYFAVVHGSVPMITIRYTVPPSGADVYLSVVDSSGSRQVVLVDRHQDNGPYIIEWDRKVDDKPLRPGIYTFRLSVGRHRLERKMQWRNW